jgi:hypothetical protein
MERDRGGSTECGARLIFTESAQVDEPVRRHVRKVGNLFNSATLSAVMKPRLRAGAFPFRMRGTS